jgi:hypothetical protein
MEADMDYADYGAELVEAKRARHHVEQYANGFTGQALCGAVGVKFGSPGIWEDCCPRCLEIWTRVVKPFEDKAEAFRLARWPVAS